MIENSDFETFLYISKTKYQIFVYDKNNLKNLYHEEVESNDEMELNILSKFIDDNIYKIEKIIKDFISKIGRAHVRTTVTRGSRMPSSA